MRTSAENADMNYFFPRSSVLICIKLYPFQWMKETINQASSAKACPPGFHDSKTYSRNSTLRIA